MSYVYRLPYEPYVVSLLDWVLVIEWYMARLVVNNGHHKDNEFGLFAHTR